MHLLFPIGIAVIVAIVGYRRKSIGVFFVFSLIAAVLVGMEIQEWKE